MSTASRREFLVAAALPAVALPFASGSASAQEPRPVAAPTKSPALAPLNRFPRMVQEWFVEQVRQSAERGNRLREALKTKADAEDSHLLRTVSRKDAAQSGRHGCRRARDLSH
jgi:hypothetical protein